MQLYTGKAKASDKEGGISVGFLENVLNQWFRPIWTLFWAISQSKWTKYQSG